MTTTASIQSRVQDRLEENPAAFWNVTAEILPYVVEGMNAACLITGDPQIRANVIYNIPANANPVGFVPLSMPADALALLRVDGGGGVTIDKVFVWDLDRHFPGWETVAGTQIQYWFPFGLTGWGVYPVPSAGQQVILSYIQFPVSTARPYTGAEVIPFQDEYDQAFEDYAAAIARLKEGGAEFDQATILMQRFLTQMEALSNFAYRKGSLRFTASAGAQSRVSQVAVR